MKLKTWWVSLFYFLLSWLILTFIVKSDLIGLSSSEIQNYELKAEIEKFKKETIESINIEDPNIYEVIDVKTDEFISKHGLMLENQEVEDEINDDKIDFI